MVTTGAKWPLMLDHFRLVHDQAQLPSTLDGHFDMSFLSKIVTSKFYLWLTRKCAKISKRKSISFFVYFFNFNRLFWFLAQSGAHIYNPVSYSNRTMKISCFNNFLLIHRNCYRVDFSDYSGLVGSYKKRLKIQQFDLK